MQTLNIRKASLDIPEVSKEHFNEWFAFELGLIKRLSEENPLFGRKLKDCISDFDSVDLNGRCILKSIDLRKPKNQ